MLCSAVKLSLYSLRTLSLSIAIDHSHGRVMCVVTFVRVRACRVQDDVPSATSLARC